MGGGRRVCWIDAHPLGVFAGEHFSHVYENGDQLAAVSTVFAARVIRGIPRPDGMETSDARFFAAAEIDALPCSAHFKVIRGVTSSVQPQAYFKPATWLRTCRILTQAVL